MPAPGGQLSYAQDMTALQQAIIHLVNVLAALTAIVVLQCTGNLTESVLLVVLAATGITATGVAGISPTSPQPAPPTVSPSPGPTKVVTPTA